MRARCRWARARSDSGELRTKNEERRTKKERQPGTEERNSQVERHGQLARHYVDNLIRAWFFRSSFVFSRSLLSLCSSFFVLSC